ncbi:MAG: potassium efflux system protein [Alteromonas macleodii]|jgi:potassium efflux system protein
MNHIIVCFFAYAFFACATSLAAQDIFEAPLSSETAASQSVSAPDAVFSDIDDWNSLTRRAVSAIEVGRASSAAFGNLRSELTIWRDKFLLRQSVNVLRIATVQAQITSLGDVPEAGEEDARVSARRADLTHQLRNLRAPVSLAAEAFSQADGLIREIDSLVRERKADRLVERMQSPLNPAGWARTWDNLKGAQRSIRAEVTSVISNPSRRLEFVSVLPVILFLVFFAVVLILRGRAWFDRVSILIITRSNRSQKILSFMLSLGQVIIWFVTLTALTHALILSGMMGRRLDQIIDVLPELGLFPILAHWIASRLLLNGAPLENHQLGLVGYDLKPAHHSFILLGYSLMLFGVAREFMTINSFLPIAATVFMFPFGLLLAWTLYRFGQKLRKTLIVDAEDGARYFRATLRSLISRGLILAALAGALFAGLGYGYAFDVLTFPAALTIYVLAILITFHQLSVDVYSLLTRSNNGSQDALFPVLIASLLILVALPILAIVWGAKITDITELWAQFREGFSIGATRISPTSFLLFAMIFAIGYTITKLVQAALRTTVLPRTKMDAGGQNAIVAGTGYVGIFLAAIVAISTAGIDLSGFAIVAGALSVGIGFGMQNIVSNFVSGIILLIERPISKGDWIEVGGQMGHVRDISVRSTRIETFDRTDVIVPNADLVSNQVTNWTRGNNVGRAIVPVGVAYGTDTDRVTEILREIAEAHPMVVMNPPPSVVFMGFGADSLDFQIRAILRDVNYVLSVKSDMNHSIAKRFVAEGIEIPFGQRDIWLRNPEVLNLNEKRQVQTLAPQAVKNAPSKDDAN